MRALILSDLHLGSPLFDDRAEIVYLITSNEFDEIILLGDIFDAWEKNFHSIMIEYKSIIDAIWSMSIEKKVVFVIGNHDPSMSEIIHHFPLVKLFDVYPFQNGVMIHGHQFDDLILKYSWLARFLFKFQWLSERLFKFNLKAYFRELYHSISMKKQKKYYNSLVLDIEKEAVEKYKQYKYVVMGHTHFPKMVKGEKTKYVNAGDWIHNRSYITYESEADDFQLVI